MFFRLAFLFVLLSLSRGVLAAEPASTNRYAAIEAIFTKHCLDCHAAQDPEGKLVMESFAELMKGGESGPAIVPGQSKESLLVQMIEGRVERDGKQRIMPPGKRAKLDASEIAAVKSWIDAGAHGPGPGASVVKELVVPKITPKVPPRRSVYALAYAPSSKLIAVGRHGEVELIAADTRMVLRKLEGHRGNVNDLAFSEDGSLLFAAAGEAGLFGEVRQWNVTDGKLIRTFEGHRDAIYSVALSPDGKLLATGSYEQKIKFWKVSTGEETKTLTGHNGAVFDLAFRQDGKILASACADRTVKLWDVASGERRDTLSQSLKEVFAVAFAPDGKRLVAGGVDNRIRVWEISESAAETTNPMLEARFAHEGGILRIVFSKDGKSLLTSADDRSVKIWDANPLKERRALEAQPDWATGIAFALDDKAAVVGRLDGVVQFYDAAEGKILPLPKPALVRAEPRGLQRGTSARMKLVGSNLVEITELKLHHPKLSGGLAAPESQNPNELWITLTAASDLPRGAYELSLSGVRGESGRLKVHVDDLPHVQVTSDLRKAGPIATKLPVSIWATHEKPGDAEEISIEARAGQTIVFDAAAKSLGSKSDLMLELHDSNGVMLAGNNGFDGSPDPLLIHTFSADGAYRLRVKELLLGSSSEHFYRLSIGAFQYVTGIHPLSVPANRETEVQLIGANLQANGKVRIAAGGSGEKPLALDPDEFRARREFKVIVGHETEALEIEPNDLPGQSAVISAPGASAGRIWSEDGEGDVDCFRFHAKAGESWIIETAAARRGTPLDSKVEILHPDGKPVLRMLLQAVRNSAVTFRGIDSNTADCRVENWEEMDLNQYLYLQGEVVKLFRAPQGPDSGFLFYTSNGKRRTYFDTSATAHANEEPCYIVEPQAPGATLVANGLPVFQVFYANDDDGERRLGSDSKIHFTAPSDGEYVIRVTDARGYHGPQFAYRLMIREPKADFNVTLAGANPAVAPGSGQAFSVNVERMDGFEREVEVRIENLPPGFSVSSPLVVQAGHTEAKGTINAALDASRPTDAQATNSVVVASAEINGRRVEKRINNLGRIRLAEMPKLFVALEPETPGLAAAPAGHAAVASGAVADAPRAEAKPELPAAKNGKEPLVITIAPGQIVPAWLKVRRNGHDELITFTVENLPHGVIVDNIGLNGVLIPKDQSERQIFFSAAKWVPETDRLCFAVENQAGRQTSLPVLLRVRRSSPPIADRP